MRKSDLYGNAIQTGLKDDSFGMGYKSRAEDMQQKVGNDAKLAELIKGSALKREESDADVARAEGLRDKYGEAVAVHTGSASLGDTDPLARLLKRRELAKPQLTDAEHAIETAGGKKLADYTVGGGRATAEKNIEQVGSVEADLKSGKRDIYDRKVGGLLNSFPSLMGAFAPAEKARRDKAYNAAMMLARQSDPNPTENQIRNIMGQIYDPSSDDNTNLERIQRFQQQQRGVNDDMARSAENLRTTGYITPGLAGNSPAPRQPPVQPAPLRGMQRPAPQTAPQQGGTGLEHLSDEQLQQMAKQLGL